MRKAVITTAMVSALAGIDLLAQNWPNWRGPNNDGISNEKNLPDTWSATCAGTADFASPSPPVGGPSAEVEAPKPGGGQRNPNTNFEGRPIVPTVCANV
jgi:hypothetical protein